MRVNAPALQVALAYHLSYRREVLLDTELRRFRDWLISEAVR